MRDGTKKSKIGNPQTRRDAWRRVQVGYASTSYCCGRCRVMFFGVAEDEEVANEWGLKHQESCR